MSFGNGNGNGAPNPYGPNPYAPNPYAPNGQQPGQQVYPQGYQQPNPAMQPQQVAQNYPQVQQPAYPQPQTQGYPQVAPQQAVSGFGPAPGVAPVGPSPEIQGAIEALDRDLKRTSRRSNDVDRFVPGRPSRVGEVERTVVRILPNWKDPTSSTYWHSTSNHFYAVDVGGRTIRLPRKCLAKTTREGQAQRACPICERADRAQAAGDEETAKELAPSSKHYVNVIEIGQDGSWKNAVVVDPQTGAQKLRSKVWAVSTALMRKLGLIMQARGAIWDLQHGVMIFINCTRSGSSDWEIKYDLIDGGQHTPLGITYDQLDLFQLDQIDEEKSYADLAAEMAKSYPETVAAPQVQPQWGGAQQWAPQAQVAPQVAPQAQWAAPQQAWNGQPAAQPQAFAQPQPQNVWNGQQGGMVYQPPQAQPQAQAQPQLQMPQPQYQDPNAFVPQPGQPVAQQTAVVGGQQYSFGPPAGSDDDIPF